MRRIPAVLMVLLLLSGGVRASFAAEKAPPHYALLINGGGILEYNEQRFLENIRAFHEALRKRGVPPENITVLYGSGKLKDTKFAAGDGLDLNQYVLGDAGRRPDGAATRQGVVAAIQGVKARIAGTGGDLLVFVTGYGSRSKQGNKPAIALWGESMTVDELNDAFKGFPPTAKIRIVTNATSGAALDALTRRDLCVFANQRPDRRLYSESSDFDFYGQNFPFGLASGEDIDGDGKRSLMDAHLFGSGMDNPENVAYTSLDGFLDRNRDAILRNKAERTAASRSTAPVPPPNKHFIRLAKLISGFDDYDLGEMISTRGIPPARMRFVTGRLERKIAMLSVEDAFAVSTNTAGRVPEWRRFIVMYAKYWPRATRKERDAQSQKANLAAQMLKIAIARIAKVKDRFEMTGLEMDLLKYGDERLLTEYLQIRECLEGEY